METTTTRRRWPWVAGIVAALLLGYGAGAAAQDTPAAAEPPEPEVVTETVVETVTETVEVEVEVGGECRDYAAWLLDRVSDVTVIMMGAFSEMADILDADGYLVTWEYVDILERATADVDDLTGSMVASGGYDCPVSS